MSWRACIPRPRECSARMRLPAADDCGAVSEITARSLSDFIGRPSHLGGLRRCCTHTANQTLFDTVNLALPAAASSSLGVSLAEALAAGLSSVERFPTGKKYHNHSLRATDLRPHQPVILTLRDPVSRLESAFRHEVTSHHGFHYHIYSKNRGTTTLERFVSMLRNGAVVRSRLAEARAPAVRDDQPQHH